MLGHVTMTIREILPELQWKIYYIQLCGCCPVGFPPVSVHAPGFLIYNLAMLQKYITIRQRLFSPRAETFNPGIHLLPEK